MSIKVEGIRSTKSKLRDETAKHDADALARESIFNIGNKASERAPVDTGLLSSTMISGIDKDVNQEVGKWNLLQRTEYTLKQEYEHSVYSGFIRDSSKEERDNFRDNVNKRFKLRKDDQ